MQMSVNDIVISRAEHGGETHLITYEKEKDIVRLADLLGHANINTTRIYTQVSFETQLDILDELGTMLNPAG